MPTSEAMQPLSWTATEKDVGARDGEATPLEAPIFDRKGKEEALGERPREARLQRGENDVMHARGLEDDVWMFGERGRTSV